MPSRYRYSRKQEGVLPDQCPVDRHLMLEGPDKIYPALQEKLAM